MATGSTDYRSKESGNMISRVRFSYSSVYYPSGNYSKVTITPQLWLQADYNTSSFNFIGNDAYAHSGVYLDGELLHKIDNQYGGSNVYLTTYSNPYQDYVGMFEQNADWGPITLYHDSSGNASATLGLRGKAICMADTSQRAAFSFTNHFPFSIHENAPYSVTYNANGGTGAPSALPVYYNVTYTLSSTKPSKANTSATAYTVTYNINYTGGTNPTAGSAARTTSYTFSKWNTKSDGTGTNYNPGASITPTASVTLYAQYTSSTSTASVTLPTPTRSGYSFDGWYTAASGGTKVGNGGASYTPTGNVTLYAHWTGLASTIATISSSVATQGNLALTVTRMSSAYYHKATFKIGSTTMATSSAFATSLSYTIPRSWFTSYPNDTSKTISVSVQTYTTSACTTTVGSPATSSFTMTADSGMKPTVSSGWATLAYYNTGTAASGIAGYVKGYSKAQVTFNSSKISLTNTPGATISSYAVTCLGSTDSSSPYYTPTLTATSVTVTCKVTDSRGRSASQNFTVSVMDYAKPSLSGVAVFRCNAGGTADEDGTYISVKATRSFSSLNSLNSCTLKAQIAPSGGSYGAATTLTSGTASKLGSGALSADTSYTVKIVAQDSLSNSATYYYTVPTRKWSMKFRSNGSGVAFGKAAETDNTFEVSSDWAVKFGQPLPITSGGTGATDATTALENLGGLNLSFGRKIPDNSDLNNYTTPGTYYCSDGTSAATMSNVPSGVSAGFKLVVYYKAGFTYINQELYPHGGERIYIRYQQSSVWQSWKRLIDTGSLPLSISNIGCVTEVVTMPQLSLPASGTAHDSKDVSKTGYTPVGIVGITGSGTTGCNLMEFYLSGTTASIWVTNNTATAKSPTYKLTILYFKS